MDGSPTCSSARQAVLSSPRRVPLSRTLVSHPGFAETISFSLLSSARLVSRSPGRAFERANSRIRLRFLVSREGREYHSLPRCPRPANAESLLGGQAVLANRGPGRLRLQVLDLDVTTSLRFPSVRHAKALVHGAQLFVVKNSKVACGDSGTPGSNTPRVPLADAHLPGVVWSN